MDGKQIKVATITKDKLNLTTGSGNDPATVNQMNTAINNALYSKAWKDPVRVAVFTNVNISNPGTAVFDGVTLNNGDPVLLGGQSTASQNWIYIFNGSGVAMTRRSQDSSPYVQSEDAVLVQEGTKAGLAYKITTLNPITLDTTSLTVSAFSTVVSATPTTSNKFMAASITAVDGDVACSTGLANTPNNSSFVKVNINGDEPEIGNGVKTKACYFSGDSGSTARAFGSVVSGDKLYWNGSIAGYQLAVTDLISFEYDV
jgi:hypothetical protein